MLHCIHMRIPIRISIRYTYIRFNFVINIRTHIHICIYKEGLFAGPCTDTCVYAYMHMCMYMYVYTDGMGPSSSSLVGMQSHPGSHSRFQDHFKVVDNKQHRIQVQGFCMVWCLEKASSRCSARRLIRSLMRSHGSTIRPEWRLIQFEPPK